MDEKEEVSCSLTLLRRMEPLCLNGTVMTAIYTCRVCGTSNALQDGGLFMTDAPAVAYPYSYPIQSVAADVDFAAPFKRLYYVCCMDCFVTAKKAASVSGARAYNARLTGKDVDVACSFKYGVYIEEINGCYIERRIATNPIASSEPYGEAGILGLALGSVALYRNTKPGRVIRYDSRTDIVTLDLFDESGTKKAAACSEVDLTPVQNTTTQPSLWWYRQVRRNNEWSDALPVTTVALKPFADVVLMYIKYYASTFHMPIYFDATTRYKTDFTYAQFISMPVPVLAISPEKCVPLPLVVLDAMVALARYAHAENPRFSVNVHLRRFWYMPKETAKSLGRPVVGADVAFEPDSLCRLIVAAWHFWHRSPKRRSRENAHPVLDLKDSVFIGAASEEPHTTPAEFNAYIRSVIDVDDDAGVVVELLFELVAPSKKHVFTLQRVNDTRRTLHALLFDTDIFAAQDAPWE